MKLLDDRTEIVLMLPEQRHTARLHVQPRVITRRPAHRIAPTGVVGRLIFGRHPVGRISVGVEMFLEPHLNREPAHVLAPAAGNAISPVDWCVQRDRVVPTGFDVAVEEEAAGVAINVLKCRHAKLVDDRADRVLPRSQMSREVQRVVALRLRKTSRRPMMNPIAIHQERVS